MATRVLLSNILLLLLPAVSLSFPNIQDLKARYHPPTSSIFVEWNFAQPLDNVRFNIRYMTNRPGEQHWQHLKSSDSLVRLNMPNLSDGDELHVQVNAERGGRIIEDWSQVLVITVTKKSSNAWNEDATVLMPPTNFTAYIQDTSSVRLVWSPVSQLQDIPSPNDLYYIVNIKQLTTKSGGALQRQQIKTSSNSFTMGRLVAGERYEFTIRSALSETRVSTTAAIVEITMPSEDEYFEIGNLIISSLFKNGGVGVVNLTWDVPQKMANKIKGYEVQYAESGKNDWNILQFNGPHSSVSLNSLKKDTEYLLKIKTILQNDLFIESGQFNFKTPNVVPNPIRKVDVIYSHDMNTARLHWILEPHVDIESVAGYDVYVSENKDLPDTQWRHIPIGSREGMLNMGDLKSHTTYYVRVNVRKTDGSTLRATSLYRFSTIDWRNSRSHNQFEV